LKSLFCIVLTVSVFIPAVLLQAQDNDNEPVEIFRLSHDFFQPDTRSAALGDATVGDVFSSLTMISNPAIIAMNPGMIEFHSSGRHFRGSNIWGAQVQLPVLQAGINFITISAGAKRKGPPSLRIGDSPEFNPDLRSYYSRISYGIRISEYVSAGISQRFTLSELDGENDVSFTTDLGFIYNPDGPVSYGIAMRGIGNAISAVSVSGAPALLDSSLDRQVLEIGATLNYPYDSDEHIFSMSLSNEKRFGIAGLTYKGGFEYLPLEFLAIRGGLQLQSEENTLAPRFGLGLNFAMFSFEYAMAPDEIFRNDYHQFGLSVRF
jgi:hypothetical protein